MGWLWGKDDPLKDIDPTLRDYLKEHAPKAYDTANTSTYSQADPSAHRDQGKFSGKLGLSVNEPDFGTRKEPQTQPDDGQSSIPKESLFQDGRYKHLWKTYRPQVQTEEAGKSDQEKLMDILGGFRQRQEQIKTVALENCAEEQWAIQECFKSGSCAARMTMCRSENKALERCVTLQSQFLRALGYLSPYQRSDAESERIQMHADTLYHRMLDQERQIQEAKDKGLPPPDFAPLIKEVKQNERSPDAASGDPHEVRPRVGVITLDTLPDEIKKQLLETRLQGKQGPEAELVMKELNQEIAVNEAMIQQLETRYVTERNERLQRLERGEERVTDKVRRWFDFRDYSAIERADASHRQKLQQQQQQQQQQSSEVQSK